MSGCFIIPAVAAVAIYVVGFCICAICFWYILERSVPSFGINSAGSITCLFVAATLVFEAATFLVLTVPHVLTGIITLSEYLPCIAVV